MLKDAKYLVKRCTKCQSYSRIMRRIMHQLATSQIPIGSAWPFAQWGMDILGPFPIAAGQRKFLVVAIDHFTKWVEAEPLATITPVKIKDFFHKSIICRFRIPYILIIDNGKQFDYENFRGFYDNINIELCFSSVVHP